MQKVSWVVSSVPDHLAQMVLNQHSASGYEVVTIISRDKSDTIGVPHVTIISRRVELEKEQEG